MTTTERTQKKRHLKITTPLGEDKVLLVSMIGSEALGRLFEFDLEIASESEPIKPADLLGKSVTIALKHLDEDADPRYFNGIINRITLTGVDQAKDSRALFTYRATLVPKLWLLTRCADCRIFQNKKVPDIIQQIFRDHGYTDVDAQLTRTYREWEYCVQYRETDFNFVSRLMENEGIYYYFKHENGKHTIVLCDAPSCHSAAPNYDKLEFDEFDAQSGTDDYLWDWAEKMEITPTKYVITDYNFTTPSTNLQQLTSISHSHDPGPYEMFDYPGEYTKSAEGKEYVAARMQELQAQYVIATGDTSARGIYAGCTFKLEGHPITPNSENYLITTASYQFHNDDMGLGLSGGGELFACQITAIPNKFDFRSARTTPKPVVQGPQTARVVGPSGEEIYTDKYGRIKVQFFWDRQGKANESSSCWIRVSQPWAGKNWGGHFLPRMGMEVIVEFLEGDPDRPLVTGCVYHAENMYPYALPDNKTRSGIKTRSSKGGSPENFNEIRFEDKKGEEQILIHAERNYDIEVEKDETHSVGHDRVKTIDHDETTTVKHDRTETVENDENITIEGNRTETVEKDESITINGNRIEEVAKDETITITKNRTTTVSEEETVSVGKNRSVSVQENDTLTVTKELVLTAGDSITLTTGDASITMEKDGTITIKGKDITIDGSGKVNVQASSDVTIKGSSIKEN